MVIMSLSVAGCIGMDRKAQGAGRRAQGAGRKEQGAGSKAQGAGRRIRPCLKTTMREDRGHFVSRRLPIHGRWRLAQPVERNIVGLLSYQASFLKFWFFRFLNVLRLDWYKFAFLWSTFVLGCFTFLNRPSSFGLELFCLRLLLNCNLPRF